jgi:WS/DGAT/MGAT family acyltransferase
LTERLSASDMSSLLAERGPIHVHVGATIVVEGEPPPFAELVAHVDRRLPLIPRFRQKITGAGAAALSNPLWADDASFELERHVRRLALPSPGGMEELRELVGRVMSEPLDLTRPLWQLYLVEGVEGDRHAYVSKTHHALVDGVAAVDVGTIILDASPEGAEMEVSEERWEPDEPSPELLFVRDAPIASVPRCAPRARRRWRR